MNKQDEAKAREISYHYLQQVDCFKKTKYDEYDIISTARDAAIEMAAWKEEQMIEKTCEWMFSNHIHYPNNGIGTELIIKDFKKAMTEE